MNEITVVDRKIIAPGGTDTPKGEIAAMLSMMHILYHI